LALLALRAVERTRPVAASHGEAGAAGARSARGSKDAEAVKKQKRRQTSGESREIPYRRAGIFPPNGTSVLQIYHYT
jgi:hypothetical protein